MKEVREFSPAQIDAALKAAGEKFTLASVAKALGAPRSNRLRRKLEQKVAEDDRFFHDDKGNCRTRESFFRGMRFLVTPDEWEIAEGVLFPGHRFVPFLAETVFPSEAELFWNGAPLTLRRMDLPLGKIFHYHVLLGSEQIFDFLLAENRANIHLRRHADASAPVILEAFDLKTFYTKNRFTFGDALLCTVTDHEAGKITVDFLPGTARPDALRKKRIAALDEAMGRVWKKYSDYLDIPAQLAWAEYYASLTGDTASQGASVDEFITASRVVELRPEGDHAVLFVRGQEEDGCGHDHDDAPLELPEGLSISSHEIDDPVKILSGAGFPLTVPELESFMLDAIYGRETDIDGVFSRIFGHAELDLADEAQQAVLMNFLEERFEDLLDHYSRADDEPKAELRSQLLDAVRDRLDFLSYLGSLGRDINETEHQKLHDLAEISAKIGEAMKLLNNPAYTPDPGELEHLASHLDELLDRQEAVLGDFRTGDDPRNE